jgi:hypothetical protein
MNARNCFAGLLIAAAAAPAFAAGELGIPADEGLPPDIAQNWKRGHMPIQESSAEAKRTPVEVIRTQSVPATTYVGA